MPIDRYASTVALPVQLALAGSRNAHWASGFPTNGDQPMPRSIAPSRTAAFVRQGGRCFYCQCPMWLSDVKGYSSRHQLSPAQSRPFRCTAEHLVARRDGGSNAHANIVAACFTCNKRRHARSRSLTVEAYRHLVRSRLRQGRWHVAAPSCLPRNSALLTDANYSARRTPCGAAKRER